MNDSEPEQGVFTNQRVPRTGEDTYTAVDDALATLASARGAWLGDPLTSLALLQSLIQQAEQCMPILVAEATAWQDQDATSWEEVAHALATSADLARQRFDPASPVADGRWPSDVT